VIRRSSDQTPVSIDHATHAEANSIRTDMTAPRDPRSWMRWVMMAVYGFIGVVHLVAADRFLPIMPHWVPEPRAVVLMTGLFEIVGVVALMIPRLRPLAGILFALYAVCVFPANLKHAFEHVVVPPIPDSWWYHGPRLAAQPVMIWWALFATHVIDWPFARPTNREHRIT
jgi:uncharacterized membrane protein